LELKLQRWRLLRLRKLEKERIKKEQLTSKSCGKGYGSNETKTMNVKHNFETEDLKEVVTKIKWRTVILCLDNEDYQICSLKTKYR